MRTRGWARGVTTTYTYTQGLLTLTDYSDATPDVAITYEPLGRQSTVTQANQSQITTTYDPAKLNVAAETIRYDLDHDGTYEFTRVLNRSRDSLNRDTGYQLTDGTTRENQAAYGYSITDGRLAAVSGGDFQPPSPANTFTYAYLPGSNLIEKVTGPSHDVTNAYEPNRDVLASKRNKLALTVISKYDYTVNAIGQRTGVNTSGTAFPAIPTWLWSYDNLGQVTSADSSVDTSDRAFEYDAIGNRKKSADSLTLPTSDNYTSNALNQYSAVESVSPSYDFDGNATAYPLPVAPTTNSTLVWDAENRQISSTVGSTTTSYLYDAQSRRIAKTTGGTSTLYVYDAWNCIAEYAGTTLSKTRLWGTDLSGTLQGAGGVGGLLSESSLITSTPITFNTFFPTYDGNGNISEYLGSTGSAAAHFEYDPFGNTVVNTDASNQFAYRFSTKPLDFATGLYYYGYRYYDPVTGRWPSRDPIAEAGGINLYGFTGNNGVNETDFLGLNFWSWTQYVPLLGTAYSMIHHYPGELESDYTADTSQNDSDDGLACTQDIERQLRIHLADMTSSAIAKVGIEAAVGGAAAFAGPPGWIADGVLALDGIAGAASTYHNAAKMKKAAKAVIDKKCRCGDPLG